MNESFTDGREDQATYVYIVDCRDVVHSLLRHTYGILSRTYINKSPTIILTQSHMCNSHITHAS